MKLPEVRSSLVDLSEDARVPKDVSKRLLELASEITRRPPRRVSKPVSAKATPALRRDIKEFASNNPAMSQLEIGRRFNVNPGRVSEALRGFRQ